jgi:hypothetical protein
MDSVRVDARRRCAVWWIGEGEQMPNLRVRPAKAEDMFKDVVRVSAKDRGAIRYGRLCKITVNGKSRHLVMRGVDDGESGIIKLDEITRDRFGLSIDLDDRPVYANVKIRRAGLFAWAPYMLNASDPAILAAARISFISFLLGVVSIILAFCPPSDWPRDGEAVARMLAHAPWTGWTGVGR